jgi:uridine kinase
MSGSSKSLSGKGEANQKALLDNICSQVLDLIDRGKQTPIVLIDGRAGSGKSTFAEKLQQQLFRDGESAPRVIHMDAIFEGWDGLSLGADYLLRFILNPLARGETASWQDWSWVRNERSTWREFSGGTPLIVEGCGSLNERSKEHADISIWLEASEEVRRERWLNRERHLDKFDFWAAQELDFYAREKSQSLADLVIKTD